MHAEIGRLDVRVTGVESSITKLSSAVENTQTFLAAKIESAMGSIYTRIEQQQRDIYIRLDQQQRDTRPNFLGWAGAAFAAITVSLTIGGAFGGLWKTSVDDRFLTLLSTVRDMKTEMIAGDKEIRGAMLTRDEYASRTATEIARRQDQFGAMGDRMARDEAEIVRLRDSAATKDDRSLIIGRFQEQNERLRADIRGLRERMDSWELRPRP